MIYTANLRQHVDGRIDLRIKSADGHDGLCGMIYRTVWHKRVDGRAKPGHDGLDMNSEASFLMADR